MKLLGVLFPFTFCLWGADALQLRVPDVLAPPSLPPLPRCMALRKLCGKQPAAAAAGIARLLSEALKDAACSPQIKEERLFIAAVGRPLERLPLRRTLGCRAPISLCEGDNGTREAQGDNKTGQAFTDVSEPQSGNFCSSADIGLEVLPSGAVLLTLELPAAAHEVLSAEVYHPDPESNSLATETKQKTAIGPLELHGADSRVGDAAPTDTAISVVHGDPEGQGKVSRTLDGGLQRPREAAMVEATAKLLVEAADVLVVSLLHSQLAGEPQCPGGRQATPFGEFLGAGAGTEEVPLKRSDSKAASSSRSDISLKKSDESSRPVEAASSLCVRLPEEVVQLLRAMQRLSSTQVRQESASDSQVRWRLHSSKKQQTGRAFRRRPLPHVVLLVGEAVSPALQAAVETEVRRHLKHPDAEISVVAAWLPEEEARACDTLRQLFQQTEAGWRSASQVTESLAALLTGPVSGLASSVEFPSSALSCGACAAAARRSLRTTRKQLAAMQGGPGKDVMLEAFGAAAQRLFFEALSSYNFHTRRFQLSPERKLLRAELRRCLERDLRVLYIREALRIENSAKARLRAALVAALRKDARHFGPAAHNVLKSAMSTVDDHLACLLPPSALSLASRLKQPRDFTEAASPGTPERCSGLEALEAAAATARENWLCQSYNVSLVKLHSLLLQRLAKEFLSMAMELSKSPLAALLRQQHANSWFGVSLQPSLVLTTLLRVRGNGNLQGYSQYNAGPVQFLFGFTNDGEGMDSSQQAAFRMQPKLHLDVEVD